MGTDYVADRTKHGARFFYKRIKKCTLFKYLYNIIQMTTNTDEGILQFYCNAASSYLK